MQCYSYENLSCGASAQYVDIVTNEIVDGEDHCPTGISNYELECVSDAVNSTFDG